MDDAEERLKDNLDGLDWLVPQLEGHPAGPRPRPRTPVPPPPAETPKAAAARRAAAISDRPAAPYDPARCRQLSSRTLASTAIPPRGAAVFASAKFACLSCHKVGDQGAMIGPDLSTTGTCLKPEEVVESVLWPRRQVKEAYAAYTIATSDGKIRQGYKVAETPTEIVFRDPASAERFQVAKSDIEEIRQDGTLMPDGLTAAMSPAERRDLIRFLFDLGRTGSTAADSLRRHSHAMAEFVYRPSAASTPSSGRTGNTRSIATASTNSMPRRPRISRSSRRPRLCCPLSRARWRQARALGQPERSRPGPTTAGTRPTWARS